jgi:ankyrin repeat protein
MDIFEAARSGDVNAVTAHVKIGASIDSNDRYGVKPIVWAAYSRKKAAVKCRIDLKASVNARGLDGITAVMRAVENKDMERPAMLIAAKAGLNITDNYRGTVLTGTKEVKSPELAELLI